jgi:hypothetical protein
VNHIEVFSTWTPFDLLESPEQAEELLTKSREPNPNGGDSTPLRGKIGGVISSEARDQQGEKVFRDGMDFSYFLKHGWFNHEHQQGPENVLGEPERVFETVVKGFPGTAVEGYVYLHKPKARECYETAQSIRKAASSRRLGYSVEGAVVQRHPANKMDIVKSRVLNVAITAHPVHPDARLEVLAKAATMMGYGDPSSGGGTFGPLMRQSIDAVPAIATFSTDFGMGRISLSDLATLISDKFKVPLAQARQIAEKIASAVG